MGSVGFGFLVIALSLGNLDVASVVICHPTSGRPEVDWKATYDLVVWHALGPGRHLDSVFQSTLFHALMSREAGI